MAKSEDAKKNVEKTAKNGKGKKGLSRKKSKKG